MKKIVLLFLVVLPLSLQAATFSVYEAGYPQQRDYNVRVEKVTDVVRRQGVYIEHNVYLNLSYDFNSWFFKNYDELELEWQFQMPEEVIMFNLYYWSGDSIFQANILDRWTAVNLFNEKSSPYREPALLTMSRPSWNGQVTYKLRLFPITRGQSQRIMIQYLLPSRATSGKIRTWLPINQLTMPDGGAKSLRVEYFYGTNSDEPMLIGKKNFSFKQYEKDALWEATFPIEHGNFLELVLPSPIESDFYIMTYQQDTDNYYQLAIYPPALSVSHEPRKLLILIDYNQDNTKDMTGELLLSSLKETMLRSLTPQDSVAIIAGFEDLAFGSSDFLPCTTENLDIMLGRIFKYEFLHINTSQELLSAGADYISQRGSNAEVLWITNRNDFSTDENVAKNYARQVQAIYPAGTTFHVLDLENKSYLISYQDYGYVARSFPFLRELTRTSKGNLFFLRFHPLKTALAALFFEKTAHFEEVEVQTRMQTGYTYSNRIFSLFRGYYPLDFPVIQTGKFDGDFPMHVTIIGWTYDQQVKKELTISEADVVPGTEEIATAYYGHYLQNMAHSYQDNWLISEMVDLSLISRVLTAYTAFLVPTLESAHYIPNFEDETEKGSGGTGVATKESLADSTLLFVATPNPFNPSTTFKITVPEKFAGEKITIDIFNIMGQRVRRLEIEALSAGHYEINWNATNDAGIKISSGTYFAILRVKTVVNKLKVIYLS